MGQSHREGVGYEDKYILPTFSVGCEFTIYYVAGPWPSLMAATLIIIIIIIIIIINDIYKAQTSPRSKCAKLTVAQ